ncbi:prepilin-type N-terminal cleavage/methylation domain-containing protein [Aeromonas hydrophila]|uniref:prepilin-type N-terminal cleavage/methylation domain-containing protein n=1 Tax=Aeromonas hydrophila TaxID=644 RepID=UPI001CC5F4C5|nr:type II secretion system protein [Aeromonas hydrophila]
MSISHQRGMTLLELLVVMVLLAVISTLLMQGLAVALSTYEKVQRRQYEGVPRMLASSWFVQSVAAMEARLDADSQFKGNASSMSGMSHSALVSRNGQIQPVAWRINQMPDGRVALQYEQPGIVWILAQWPAGTKAQFLYRDHDGTPQTLWPPSEKLASLVPDGRIPSAVLLEVAPPSRPSLHWYVSLTGRRLPRMDYRDL